MSFIKSLVKGLGNEEVSLMSDGTGSAEFNSYIDSGSFTLNACFGGSLFAGFADNKVGCLAGVESVGKTYFLLGIIRAFLKSNPTAIIGFFDTEGATTKKMMQDRGINTENVMLFEPTTIEMFKNQALKLILDYEELKPDKGEEKPKLFIALDSLGQLSTNKEMTDSIAQKDTKDMTRAGVIRGAFRVLRLKCAKLHIPMIITNHTYTQVTAYGGPQTMSGGGGPKYAADNILMLSKAKIKDDEDDVIGSRVTIKVDKSRLSREKKEASTRIMYDGGIDRYYGLLDMAIDSELWKKISTKVAIDFYTAEEAAEYNKDVKNPKEHAKEGDPKTLLFGKEIESNPTKYFTLDFLKKLDVWVKANYQYGAFADVDDILDKTKAIDEELEALNN